MPDESAIFDTWSYDAFNRIRVSQPTTLFDSQAQYGLGALLWDTAVVGTGAAAHVANDSTVTMSTTAQNDACVRQSRQYHRYQPGKSQLVLLTTVLGARTAGVTKRFGYFDASNGVFFEQTSAGFSVVMRSKSSGEIVETRVAQSTWLSQTTFDETKSGIFFFDLEWLGVGIVRAGIVIGGTFHVVHVFNPDGGLTTTYMTTANLPVRYEIVQAGATAGSMKQICSTVVSEGGFSTESGLLFSTSNAETTIAVTTRRPVLSIRPAATLNSIVNRIQILPETVFAYAGTNPAHIEVVYGGSIPDGSWGAVNANSGVEVNKTGTSITGGITIFQFPVVVSGTGVTARGGGQASLLSKMPLTLSIAGDTPILLTIVATSLNATANVAATINWREVS